MPVLLAITVPPPEVEVTGALDFVPGAVHFFDEEMFAAAALKCFNPGFEAANVRKVRFDACHECLFLPFLEALVAVGQVVRLLKGVDV